jgi:hypothetical protein
MTKKKSFIPFPSDWHRRRHRRGEKDGAEKVVRHGLGGEQEGQEVCRGHSGNISIKIEVYLINEWTQ